MIYNLMESFDSGKMPTIKVPENINAAIGLVMPLYAHLGAPSALYE